MTRLTYISVYLLLFIIPLATQADDISKQLDRITLANGQQISYQQLLQQNKLTGLSLAVVDNYQIVYSRTVGLKEYGTQQKIDRQTAFSTASIAKPITATLVAMLAEKGLLQLDDPVSKYLKRWQMPQSEFTKNNPITFRHLLSHTAGTSQSGFADFYLGEDIPTAIESLNGIKLPRYKQAIDVTFSPGSNWNYSGGGYVIIQIALEDITGKPLALLAEEMLFQPLGMENSSMYQHGHQKFPLNVAKVHDDQQQVIKTGLPICPQVAPSGLWSTPTDMAKFVIDYQLALAGKSSRVISNWVAKQTTKLQTLKVVGGWSMGWMRFESDANLDWFSHGGSNTGTGGQMMGTMQGGRGIMLLANGGNAARYPSIAIIKQNIIDKLNWDKPLIASEQASPTKLTQQLTGRYLSQFDSLLTIKEQDNTLTFHGRLGAWYGLNSGELVYQGSNKFAVDTFSNQLSLELNPKDQELYLSYSRKNSPLKAYSYRKLGTNEMLPYEVAFSQDYQSTLTAYKQWQQQYPDSRLVSTKAIKRSAQQALQKNDYHTAIRLFRTQLVLYPKHHQGLHDLAKTYQQAGNKKLATQGYQKLLALEPDNQQAKSMLKQLTRG